MDTSTLVLTLLFLTLLSYLTFYLNKYRSYVYSLGVPVDCAKLWNFHKTNFRQRDVDLIKKLGKIWVDYTATVPTIVIAEPNVIKDIMVKHFSAFTNRIYFGVEEQHMSLIDARYTLEMKYLAKILMRFVKMIGTKSGQLQGKL